MAYILDNGAKRKSHEKSINGGINNMRLLIFANCTIFRYFQVYQPPVRDRNFFTFGLIYYLAKDLGVLDGPGKLDLRKLQSTVRAYCREVKYTDHFTPVSVSFRVRRSNRSAKILANERLWSSRPPGQKYV